MCVFLVYKLIMTYKVMEEWKNMEEEEWKNSAIAKMQKDIQLSRETARI